MAFVLVVRMAAAEAQRAASAKVPGIGYLSPLASDADAARSDLPRAALRELGYVEGKNITIGWRVAQGNLDRVREFADERVRLKVDVIVSPGPTVTRMVKDVTSTIPLSWPMIPIRRQRVRRQSCDPVETSLVGDPRLGDGRQTTGTAARDRYTNPGDEFEFVINFKCG